MTLLFRENWRHGRTDGVIGLRRLMWPPRELGGPSKKCCRTQWRRRRHVKATV